MINIKLPKSWKDITIQQFIDLLPSATKGMNDVEQLIHTLATVTGESKDVIRQISLKDVKKIKPKLSFLEELPRGQMKKRFKVNGKRYEVEPDATNLSASQYMDTMEILKGLGSDNETIEKNLHLLLAVACHPIKWNWRKFKYVKGELDIINTSKVFYEHLTMDKAYPVIVFFCVASKSLTPIINDYLTTKTETIEKELSQIKSDLQNDLDG